MSAYPALATLPQKPVQASLPGILPLSDAVQGTVAPLSNGTAQLLFNGQGVGIYASPEEAEKGKALFVRAGLCV